MKPISKEQVRKILVSSSLDKSDLDSYFDCPLPTYSEFPEEDKGWLGIAKGILVKDSPYKRAIQAAKYSTRKERECNGMNSPKKSIEVQLKKLASTTNDQSIFKNMNKSRYEETASSSHARRDSLGHGIIRSKGLITKRRRRIRDYIQQKSSKSTKPGIKSLQNEINTKQQGPTRPAKSTLQPVKVIKKRTTNHQHNLCQTFSQDLYRTRKACSSLEPTGPTKHTQKFRKRP
ncbi:unnamed protein product [Moneuplotes crassus]|uniref:Uncharacterized protein n=1 Tax=Euplotes crassus TaxID=5936 RepID=A0AAD2DAW3_EUPCR|nr:unnamed protein product [Moneuplotes crassus]